MTKYTEMEFFDLESAVTMKQHTLYMILSMHCGNNK
jgi:hypothetical protein